MKRTTLAVSLTVLSLFGTLAQAASVSEVFKRVKDSIVVIRTTETETPAFPGAQPMSIGGLGSGVLIDRIGLVLTAAHVIQVAEGIEVEFTNGEVIAATVKGSIPAADLAILKLERIPTSAVAATLGDSNRVEVGDQIFIVGAPRGISHTLTVGHISARRVTDDLFGGMFAAEMFQTDAAINVGNSGGPMFDMNGEVIGIVSHMISQTGSYEGLGFVMTSNLARELLLQGRTLWTGLEGRVLRGDLARAFNLPQGAGILVQRVAKGSPADRMGLRPGTIRAQIDGEPIVLGGDVILAIDGIRMSDPDAMERVRVLIGTLSPGVEMKLSVLRDGRRIELASAPVPR